MKIKNPLNEVLFKRRRKIYIKPGKNELKDKKVEAFNAVLAKYGFTLSKKLMDTLKTLSKKDFEYESLSLVRYIRDYTKSNRDFTPLFLNFPTETQIKEGLHAKLTYFFEQMIGESFYKNGNYKTLSCGHTIDEDVIDLSKFSACPVCESQVPELAFKDNRKLKEVTPLEIIDLANKDEVYEIMNQLLSSNIPLGEGEYADIRKIVEHGKNKKIVSYFPKEIKMKETLAKVYILLLEEDKEDILNSLENKLTVTDVLRIASVLSSGDVSLKEAPYFTLSNKERRFILSLLEKTNLSIEDFIKYKEVWKRAAEKIHPTKYIKRYPNAAKALLSLKKKHRTFKTKFEELLEAKKFTEAAEYISQRPGEFARFIEMFIRNGVDIIPLLERTIKEIKTKNLIFLEKHLEGMTIPRTISMLEEDKKEQPFNQIRIEGVTVEIEDQPKDMSEYIYGRYFFPKGGAKYFLKNEYVKILDPKKVKEVLAIIRNEISLRMKRELDKKVWIDPELRTILIPKNLRDYSEGMKFYARGSRIKYKTEKVTRFFLYWKGRVDLDLSVIILDKDMNIIERCAYTDLRSENMKHSGDIRSAPNGAAEFIDIKDMRNIKNAKYVIPSVISFTGEEFSNLDAFVGVMERNKPKKGKFFEPATVKYRFDLKGNQSQIPLIYDVENEEVIIVDLYKKGSGGENTYSMSKDMIRRLSIMNDLVNTNPNMYDLFRRTYENNLVENKEEADIIIGRDSGNIKATEIEKVISRYLE